MNMGEKILKMRKARGWSQEELAEQVGVTRQAISRWESGAVKPDADRIIAICDIFGVSADYLMRGLDTDAKVEPSPVSNRKPVGYWVSWGMTAFGALVLFILRILASVNRTYISPSVTADATGTIVEQHGGYYTGFWEYIHEYDFSWLFWLSICAVIIGLTGILWRLLQKEKYRDFLRKLWR